MAYGFGHFVILELQAQAVRSHDHAQKQEEEQGGGAETGSHLRDEDREENQDGSQQEQVVRQQVDREDGERKHQASIWKRLRNPVIMNTWRTSSEMLLTMTFPPFVAAALRRERKIRSPELEM